MKKVSPKKFEGRWRWIRGHEAILDADAAELYRVSVAAVRAAVRRNPKRFPRDFVFRLSPAEGRRVAPPTRPLGGEKPSSPPLAFTLAGLMMLSGVLKGEAAAQAGIFVIRMLGAAGLLSRFPRPNARSDP